VTPRDDNPPRLASRRGGDGVAVNSKMLRLREWVRSHGDYGAWNSDCYTHAQ
jgi:hypothetical protein